MPHRRCRGFPRFRGSWLAERKRFTTNALIEGLVRQETFMGRDFTVVPVVALKEMVLDFGDHGEFVSRDSLRRSEPLWNGRPIVIGHPEDGFTANTTDQLEKRWAGFMLNTKTPGGDLRAEMWFENKRLSEVEGGSATRAQIENGKLEVSTAYFAAFNPTPGIHGGKPFTGSHENIMPDHLAALPHEVGRCSVEQGCGAPRLNQGGDMKEGEVQSLLSRIGTALATAFKVGDGTGDGETGIAGAVNNEAGGTVININMGNQEGSMDRDKVIKNILEKDGCPFDEEKLKAMSDEELTFLSPPCSQANAGEGGDGTDDADAETKALAAKKEADEKAAAEAAAAAANAGGDGDVTPAGLNPEVTALLNGLGSGGIAVILAEATKLANASKERKDALVAALVENSSMTKEALEAMSVEVLEQLQHALSPVDFLGASGALGAGEVGTGQGKYNASANEGGLMVRRGNRATAHAAASQGD